MNQASESIELVRFLLLADKLPTAVNRIYFGMYYTLTALALKHQFETSKHGQLIGWFNKEFVASGKVDIRYGKIIRNAFHNRAKGDYDVFVSFSKTEVENMLAEMIDFVNEIKRII